MNKSDLIDAIADRVGGRQAASVAIESFIDTVTRTVAKGEKVAISGFGVFEKADRAARTGRNPATGAVVRIKKTSVPKFRPGTDFKAYVSGAKKLAKATATVAKAAAPAATATKTTARATAAKKAPAKAAAPARKAATKATPARKAAVKKATPAKAPARKAAVKRAAPVRKAVVKKAAPAKKAAAKKAPARRAR